MRRLGHSARARGAGATLCAHARRLGEALRAVVGAPDYERYLRHMGERHPGEPALSRDEFHRRRLADRYDRPGSRCC